MADAAHRVKAGARLVLRCLRAAAAQRHVQHGTAFTGINRITIEHARAPAGQAARLRQLQQQLQGLIRNAVLGVIDEQRPGVECEALGALRIGGEQVAHMHIAQAVLVGVQGLPRRAVLQIRAVLQDSGGHIFR